LCSDTKYIIPYFSKIARKSFSMGMHFFSVLAMSKIYVMIGEYEYIIYMTY